MRSFTHSEINDIDPISTKLVRYIPPPPPRLDVGDEPAREKWIESDYESYSDLIRAPRIPRQSVKKAAQVPVSIADVRAALNNVARSTSKNDAIRILQCFGATRVSEVKVEDYSRLISWCNAAVFKASRGARLV